MRQKTYKHRPGERWPATMAFVLDQRLPMPPTCWTWRNLIQAFQDIGHRLKLLGRTSRDAWVRLKG